MDEQKLDIEIHELKNFSEKERKKFKDATRLLHKVVNSKEFKRRLLLLPLEQTNGKTNIEIYHELMSGKDKFNTVSDNDIDVYATMYYSFGRVVGYTYPSTWKTWINRKFFSNESDIAGNIIHEYMHNMGYGHKSPKDKMSVPYALGYLIRDMVKQLQGIEQSKDKVWVCTRSWRTLWIKKSCRWVEKQE